MKKLAIAGALMLLAGCAEVENYNNVVKTPAPDWLTGYWQTKGPQRALYEVERDGNTIEYDGMTMERVDRPTAECAAALDKAPLPTPLP
ncbi:TPA: hypothetical protein MD641_000704 [Escherichia coli]|nr:hypothetical protein [Escherichia coli]